MKHFSKMQRKYIETYILPTLEQTLLLFMKRTIEQSDHYKTFEITEKATLDNSMVAGDKVHEREVRGPDVPKNHQLSNYKMNAEEKKEKELLD